MVLTLAEAGAGVCVAAAAGVGLFADFGAGAARMVKAEKVVEPDPSLSRLYQDRYEIYGLVAEAMTPVWRRMAQLGQNGRPAG